VTKFRRVYRQSQKDFEDEELMILLTRNLKDFEAIPNLVVNA
jgi:hypothetical protein